jgi:hypothetical protein
MTFKKIAAKTFLSLLALSFLGLMYHLKMMGTLLICFGLGAVLMGFVCCTVWAIKVVLE